MIAKLIVFIFGSIVGSFLNVCIHRMPQGESVVWPRSHCPKCGKKIPGYDNIPFISFILLKRRCRFCKEKISLRYIIVEAISALSFLLLFSRFGLSFDFFFYVILLCGLIIASFVDLKHRIIPDEVSIGGAILGFILSAVKGCSLRPVSYDFHPALDSLLGIIAGGGAIYLTGFLFDAVYFKLLKKPPIQGETESMGGGDVKLLAMIGSFIGLKAVLVAFFLAPFLALFAGLANLIFKKDHTLPYGPYLSLAALAALFWSDTIIRLFILP